MSFIGETKNEWNVSQNNTKYEQLHYIIHQFNLHPTFFFRSNKNTKIDDKINLKCINLLYEYEQMQNLDVCI